MSAYRSLVIGFVLLYLPLFAAGKTKDFDYRPNFNPHDALDASITELDRIFRKEKFKSIEMQDAFLKAHMALLQRNFTKALAHLRIIDTASHENADLSFLAAILCMQNGKGEDAERHFTRALQLRPKWSQALFYRGINFYFASRYQEANKLFIDAYEIERTNERYWGWAGVGYYETRRYSELRELLLEGLRLRPSRLELQLLYALHCLATNGANSDDCKRAYSLLNSRNGDYLVEVLLMELSIQQDKLPQALMHAEKAANLKLSSEVLDTIIIGYGAENFSKIYPYCEQAKNLKSGTDGINGASISQCLIGYFQHKKYEEAISFFNNFRTSKNKESRAFAFAMESAIQLKKYDLSIQFSDEALRVEKGDDAVMALRLMSYCNKKDWRAALDTAAKYPRSRTKYAKWGYCLASANYFLGDKEAAVRILNEYELISESPDEKAKIRGLIRQIRSELHP